jgi:acetyl-CoA synthetase
MFTYCLSVAVLLADLTHSITPVDYYWPFDWTGVTKFSSTGEASDLESMLWLMSRVGTISGPDGVGSGYAPVIEYCGGTEIAGSFLSSTLLQPNIPSLMSTPVCGSRVCILNDNGNVSYSDVDVTTRRASCIIQDGVSNEAQEGKDEREMTGEIALIPPSLGLSTMLLNRVHHECYYDEMPIHQDGRLLRRHGDEIQNLPGSYFRALGRCDDTMNLGGIKVSSVEIERVCNISSPTIIAETAAIAIQPRGGGPSMLVLVVVTKPMTSGIVIDNNTTGAMLHEKESEFKSKVKSICQGAIKTKLNPLFHIYDVVLVTELPRTASNKIMRRVLRDNYMTNWGK